MPISFSKEIVICLHLALEKIKSYIPPDVVFVLHWQLSLTQARCTCDGNDSIYMQYGLSLVCKRYLHFSMFHRCSCTFAPHSMCTCYQWLCGIHAGGNSSKQIHMFYMYFTRAHKKKKNSWGFEPNTLHTSCCCLFFSFFFKLFYLFRHRISNNAWLHSMPG